MKHGCQCKQETPANGAAKPRGTAAKADLDMSDSERFVPADGAERLREMARQPEPLGAFDARAVSDLYRAALADPRGLRRTIRRRELRQIVPLADSTIYELERRGEFPRRFFLTARCVVWDLQEIEAWINARRNASNAALVKRAPLPNVHQRKRRQVSGARASQRQP